MNLAKFLEELLAKHVAAVLPESTSITNEPVHVGTEAPAEQPLLAQLPPRECLVFLAEYRIKDRYGHCLSPEEVRSQLGLTKREYNRILDAARKKLV